MDPGVEFDTDVSAARPSGRPAYQSYAPQEAGGLSGWLMKHGLAKSSRQAVYILAIVVIVNVIIMYFVWRSANRFPSNAPRPIIPGQTR